MHLARTVTHSTVEECKSRMSLAEFRHWQAQYQIEPWGDEWDQTRAVAAASLAPWSKRKVNLAKFFPKAPAQTPEETERVMQAFAKRHNAKVERAERKREASRHTPATTPGRRSAAVQRAARRRKGT